MAGIRDADICTTVATMRRGGAPDSMIAGALGVSVAQLRARCPMDESDPLGLLPHVTPPSQPGGSLSPGRSRRAPLAAPSDEGSGLALLVFILLLGG